MALSDLTSQIHRYSVDEYEELVLTGVFEDQRVELIEGLILDMSPKSPAHENAIEWLNRWLVLGLDQSRYSVRVQSSVRLSRSQPEPDLAVVDRDRPHDRHPLAAQLVIEVALSSRERDLTIKPQLYAAAVSEYWVLDLEARHFVVHRDPGEESYRTISIHGAEAMLRPSSLELEPLPVRELFEATF
jgi:Uma2 family endonuclease